MRFPDNEKICPSESFPFSIANRTPFNQSIDPRDPNLTHTLLASLSSTPRCPSPSGDDSNWRRASIQPVPIPDLNHTGIRTKFSQGANGGFTPDGALTVSFRTDIHDTIRHLSRRPLTDARDVRTKDYARAIRKHRADPCGGSLLDARMSSLELGPALGSPPGMLLARGGKKSPLRRQCSSHGTFHSTNRFSPPSSPLSIRRALASGGGYRANRDTPAENRQALLLRELSSVKRAAAAVSSGDRVGSFALGNDRSANRGGTAPPERARVTAGSKPSAGTLRGAYGVDHTASRGTNTRTTSASHREPQVEDGIPGKHSRSGSSILGGGSDQIAARHHQEVFRRGYGPGRNQGEDALDSNLGWKNGRRQRGKRRVWSNGSRLRKDHGGGGEVVRALLASAPSSSNFLANGTAQARRPLAKKSQARRLQKPFSSDSLFACLLDMRYGNTRDLSPDKPVAQKWDLKSLPAGMVAAGNWDGFGPEEVDGDAVGSNDTGRRV